MVWSCVSAATAGVKSFSGLIAVQFFLGFVEAPFFPGVSLIILDIETCRPDLSQAFYLLSCWYTRKDLALRTAVLYSGLTVATAFSSLIAAGNFAGLDGARGHTGWPWLFIIEGVESFVAAMIAFALLPDHVDSESGSGRWLLTPREGEVASARIAADRVSVPEAKSSVWYGVSLAVKDYRTWIFVGAPFLGIVRRTVS
jgi:MFS family permease